MDRVTAVLGRLGVTRIREAFAANRDRDHVAGAGERPGGKGIKCGAERVVSLN